MSSEIQVRPLERTDLCDVAALFRQVFHRSITEDELEWKYRSAVRPGSFVATHRGELVGHYGGILRRYSLEGCDVRVMIAVDAMISPRFRGQRLFRRLVEGAREEWKSAGVALILGLPNSRWVAQTQELSPVANATLRRLQAHLQVRPIIDRASPRLAGLIAAPIDRAWRTVRRSIAPHAGRLDIVEGYETLDLCEDLWRRTQSRASFLVVRDAEWLSARFAGDPLKRYRLFVLMRDQRAEAYCVVRRGDHPRVQIIADFWAATHADLNHLVAHLLETALDDDVIRMETFADADFVFQTALFKAGFFVRRKSALIHASVLDQEVGARVMQVSRRWFLSGGDFDLV